MSINLPLDDNNCGWYAALPEPKATKRLIGQQRADYVVIGAGFAGLAAARRLAELEPQARIILLDAQRVGYGASGRNSGFVIDLPHKFSLEHPDPAHKMKLLALNRAAISQLEGAVNRYGIDCQWSHSGKYQGAVGARGEAYLDHFESLLSELGEPYELIDKSKLAGITGTDYYNRAIYTPGCYLMQPAALVRGLADNLPENIELYENTAVSGLDKQAQGVKVSCPEGEIIADKILMGTSIFTKEFGFLKNRLLPMMTFASWTRPLTDSEVTSFTGQFNWGLTPADHAGTTVRMTADRRLMIRNSYQHVPKYGASVTTSIRESIKQDHRAAFEARYPQLSHVPFSHSWGGTYAISRNFTNFFGQLDDGIFATACDNGVGAAWGTISGTLLAEHVVGSSSTLLSHIKEVTGMPSLNPPEPFLGVGVKARIKLAKWQSRSEI